MHAVKGGWAGQTFALAKGNGSEGRKARIRRSKEERKEMVESFIKKYQSLNYGNFPSLNLTHKEVGGSFYTVREIVREIIQENRVLGPGKSFPEEQNIDLVLEQHPLGTISTEPQTSLHLSPNGRPLVSDPDQSTIEEYDTVSVGLCDKPEQHGFDNEPIIYGNHVIVETQESNKPKVVVAQLIGPLEAEKTFQRAKVTQMEDVMVETFPLRPVANPTDCFDESSGDVKDSNGTAEEKFGKVHLPLGNDSFLSDGRSSLENSYLLGEDNVADLASPKGERNTHLMDEKALEYVGDPSLESSNSSSTEEPAVHDTHQEKEFDDKFSQYKKAIAETKVINCPNGIQTKALNRIDAASDIGKSVAQEVVTENKTGDENKGSSEKGNAPTLDRINLESWEGTSKSPAEAETSTLWAILKGFITAFMKFLSE